MPTWNYLAVHLTGRVHIHQDPAWLRHAVSDLTDHHEQQRAEPWRVSDAPTDYLDAQLRAIVGVEMHVEHVDAKAKLSQNRLEQDQLGVINGLRNEPPNPASHAIAAAMQDRLS